MRPSLHGVSDNEVLFTVGEQGVIVNTRNLTASVLPVNEAIERRFWLAASRSAPIATWQEVADHAVASHQSSDVAVVTAGGDNRAYTVPKAVATTARTALQASFSLPAGETPVGRHMGGLLASGNQVTRQNVLWMSRFFEANTEEQTGTRTWALWGGNAGRNWVRQTIRRMPMAAAASVEANLLSFYEGSDTERTFWTSRDGENAVGLYRKAADNSWLAWGDGDWFTCDEPKGIGEGLVELDDDAAVYVAGALYDTPDTPVSLRNLDPEEFDIVESGLPGVDWAMVERAMKPGLAAAGVPGDGQYTPEERSKNASGQVRDATGRFAKMGESGRIQRSGLRGKIIGIDGPSKTFIVQADDGKKYPVPASDFEIEDPIDNSVPPPHDGPGNPDAPLPPLNLKGILGQPRTTTTTPKAWIHKLLPPMGAGQLKQVIDDYSKFITNERDKNAKKFHKGTPNFADVTPDVEGAPATQVGADKPNPDTSDVKPMYLAIVDRDDPQAVTDLVALVPASSTGNQPTAYRRVAGEWVEDVKMLQNMKSATPPPVVKLDDATYQDVLSQVDSNLPEDPNAPSEQPPAAPPSSAPEPAPTPVQASAAEEFKLSINMSPIAEWGWNEDGELCAMVAAGEGGLDRNRGGAEKLRRYWLYGKGGAKIRWGTDGDWTRCVRQLSKYLGPRAKGYCALRHHEATGMWTGDRRHRQEHSITAGGEAIWSTQEIRRTNEVITASVDAARVLAAKHRVYGLADGISPIVPQDPNEITEGRAGRAFSIPLVIPEGLESGDGRTFEKGALSMRSLPIPLLWQLKTGDGHDGSYVVGRVDRVERTDHGLGNAYGVFDTGPYGQEAQRLVENKMLRWVSADLDRFEAEEVTSFNEDTEEPGATKLRIKKGRLMGITLVAKPAFQECTIELVPLEEITPINDGTYTGDPIMPETDPQPIMASAKIANSIPTEPPKVWFDRPVLNGPTPITVTDEGQVFGHIATWDMSHIGLGNGVRAPRSASNYAYFHTGVLRTQEGADVTVGQLTLAGGHADLTADAAAAVKHYDDTGSAICDVHAGEDSYGIWVAGALRPGTTPEQIRALRASAPSGDWRVINNRHELVAVCQVNVPGFPVPRAMVAGGRLGALVAAGTETLAKMRKVPDDELARRISALEEHERARDEKRREEVLSRMAPVLEERQAAREQLENLAASAQARVYKVLDVDGYLTEFKDFSPDKRKQLADKKHALKDGSFPIENVADLRRAVKAYGRASSDKQAAVRRHIIRRARALDKTDLIPDDWSENALNDLALLREDSREVITAAALANRAEAVLKRLEGLK